MTNLWKNVAVSVVLIVAVCLFALVCMPAEVVQAKEYPQGSFSSDNITRTPQLVPQNGLPFGICIDNGIIDICLFAEEWGEGWFYPGMIWNTSLELPWLAYGANIPRPLDWGIVTKFYPSTGTPGNWYEAIIDLDLNEFAHPVTPEVTVHREIMVPSNGKCFFARYTIRNISGYTLNNLRFFEYIDYDVADLLDNVGGYYDSDSDFVWQHDLGTYVGFSGSVPSAHHDVGNWLDVYFEVAFGTLLDRNSFEGDTAVAMEWRLGDLTPNGTATLTLTYCFADSFNELLSRYEPQATLPEAAPPAVSVDGASTGESHSTRVSSPNMNIHYVRVNPPQTIANHPVTITANVVNEGGMIGSTRVALKINSQVEQTKLVTVGPGGSRHVSFTVTKTEPGIYNVIMGSQRTRFLVAEDTASGTRVDGGLIAMLLFGMLVVAVIVVLMFVFRRPA